MAEDILLSHYRGYQSYDLCFFRYIKAGCLCYDICVASYKVRVGFTVRKEQHLPELCHILWLIEYNYPMLL